MIYNIVLKRFFFINLSYAKSSSNKVLKEVLESGTKDHDDSYKLWTRRPVTVG